MEYHVRYKKYLILQMNVPQISVFRLIKDTDDKAEALRLMNRQEAMLVVEIPDDTRSVKDSYDYSFDSDAAAARNTIMGVN